jgi:hypothetical protein
MDKNNIIEGECVTNSNNSVVTIVTCYFKIPSKHTTDNYKEWMCNMLTNIETPMIIYCDKESEQMISDFRENKPTVIHILTFEDFYTYKYLSSFNYHHKHFDPEKHHHNSHLYMIWAEKSHFLKLSIETNPFTSDYFFWCDIGCFRNRINTSDIPLHLIYKWPNVEKIKKIGKSQIVLTQTGKFHPDCTIIDKNTNLSIIPFTNHLLSIGGTMFIGHKDILLIWHSVYYNTLDNFIIHDRFAGKDQNIMANITITHPELVKIIFANYGDPWFFFHWLFL